MNPSVHFCEWQRLVHNISKNRKARCLGVCAAHRDGSHGSTPIFCSAQKKLSDLSCSTRAYCPYFLLGET
jgi:hypothetical protein